MAPNNSTAERNGIIDFNMEPREHLRLVVESLSHVETTVQLLRTAVTTLYEHATFVPNQIMQTPNLMQLYAYSVAMANVNTSLKPAEVQVPNAYRSTVVMKKQNFGIENVQQPTDKTIRYTDDFINGLSNNDDPSLNKVGNNTFVNAFAAGVNNHSENSERLAYGSIVVNNTEDMLEQIDQMENDMSARNKVATVGLVNNGPSTEVNANNDDVIIIENEAETVLGTEPVTEPRAAPASITVKSAEPKGSTTMVVEVEPAANEANEKLDLPLQKRKVLISTEKVLQVLRHKGRVAAKGKMRSIMQRRSSIVPHCRSSVIKRTSSVARISFERKKRSIEPTPDPKPHKCVVDGCLYAGAQKRLLAAHMKRKHSKEPQTKERQPTQRFLSCVVYGCLYSSVLKSNLTRHMKQHTKEELVDCPKCEKKFKSTDHDVFAKHMSEHE